MFAHNIAQFILGGCLGAKIFCTNYPTMQIYDKFFKAFRNVLKTDILI